MWTTRTAFERPSATGSFSDRSARITSIDALRGAAILGILLVHLPSFATVLASRRHPFLYEDLGGANWSIWLLAQLLVDGKFIVVFAVVFGAGLEILARSGERGGLSPLVIHLRRMSVLFVIGLLHAYLVWYGDMLVGLSVCGLAAFAGRRLATSRLLTIGTVFLGVGSLMLLCGNWLQWSIEPFPWLPQGEHRPFDFGSGEIASYRGSWIDQLKHRVPTAFASETTGLLFQAFWPTTGLMMIGMSLYRQGVLDARSRRYYAALVAVGFGVGVSAVAYSLAGGFGPTVDPRISFAVTSQLRYWGDLATGFGWIGGILLVNSLGGWLRPVTDVGRMALSNYIAQSLICTAFFYGHGFGLFGRVDRVHQLLVAAGVGTLEICASRWWMKHFTLGPLEWISRTVIYSRKRPSRRRGPRALDSGILRRGR